MDEEEAFKDYTTLQTLKKKGLVFLLCLSFPILVYLLTGRGYGHVATNQYN